ncbi:uncharacterized protein Z518_02037 [Rhinocladiella mackenziei CBS 650.93]|uniref:Rhinocladiella mackenziei CBS 650.93 unplaced genomic scaffold supercont1.2, whole genome shotgun sequence n=1 Tax=Rhinocladiella mackenziei CBS 650.93 TaxID=1442369 RepID=A0A0D2INI6_9EURO|nr:uncharacterized protein Z518_02037 [Rhinocladiella mackenziei CBS 650.93]KIX07384.1 hypothetical protein Z518_02037 [Rhinocladiella mackenziei CBS 650.93]
MAAGKQDGIAANWRCFVACAIVTLSPFQYGVDFGLIGGLQAMPGFLQVYGYRAPETAIGWNISTVRQQLISSLMTLGAFISSGAAGFAAAKLGRRQCLWLACFLCCVANIIMMATTDVAALYAGRLIIGLANGYFMTFSQLYIQECSPAKYRGLFLSAFQFFTSFGTLIGTIIDWATAKRPDKSAYLIPLGIIYIVPAFLTLAMFFIPESPRWLILQGRHEDGIKSLTWLRPDGADVASEAIVIRTAIEKEQELKSSVGIWDMFRDPVNRRRTTLAVCAVTLQAASGSMFIIAYKAYFFAMAHVSNAFGMSCVLSTMGLLAILINSVIVVRYGRRRVLLMSGLVVCGVLQLIIAITYDKNPGTKTTGKVLVALACLYMMSYNGMIATYAWLSGGELPTQRLRSYTFGLAAAIGFLGAWLTTFTAPYFINPASLDWGPRYGYIWAPSCAIAALWVFFFLPEVKGRTLEEIDEMFETKLPARQFRKYKCVGSSAVLEEKLGRKNTVWGNEKATAEATVSTA